ncbi:MAG: S8 family serine peptidase [Bacteriovoracaceae bacterium]
MKLTQNLRFMIAMALVVLFGSETSFAEISAKKSKKSPKVQKAVSSFYTPASLSGRFTSWGIDPSYKTSSINLHESWKKFEKKKDVVVAVVDTGIQADHPFLSKNLYVKEGKADKNNFGVDFSKDKQNTKPVDTHGHGTHVAGIIKSIFPDVKIMALKYYNPQASGQANLNSTIKALEYAVDQNVDVINYSGGGPEPSAKELAILKKAESKGILIIAAAGNEKSNIDVKQNAYYPASYGLSNIVTVGAHNESNKIISSSNWGSKSVDIAAPGFRIKSAIPGNGAGYMTGTSQATAFVTGVVALLKAKYPEFNYQQLRNVLLSSSLKVKTLKGKVLGGGKLDAARAMDVADHVANKLFDGSRRELAKK